MNGEPAERCDIDVRMSGTPKCADGATVAAVTMKQHPLIVMVVVLVGDLFLPVGVAFPQLLVYHLLDLLDPKQQLRPRFTKTTDRKTLDPNRKPKHLVRPLVAAQSTLHTQFFVI